MKRLMTFALVVALIYTAALAHPLKEYLENHKGEVLWNFEKVQTMDDGTQIHYLHVRSQVWKGIEWNNNVALIYPPEVKHEELAVLLIAKGFSRDVEENLWIAKAFGVPFCVVGNVPNQPLFGGYSEDDLIAYTFVKFMETKEADWPLLFPMVQSVVAAMDAIEEYTTSIGGKIEGFVVTGASKRGWTTWLTAAVDERVKAIIPIVYDNLNLPKQMPHQLEMWGAYSEKISPYTKRGLPDLLSSSQGIELVKMVDPFFLRDALGIPKFIVIATNDRYWPIDAVNLYINEMPGENYILYIPNDRHDISNLAYLVLNAGSFTTALLEGKLPELNWEFQFEEDSIAVSWNINSMVEEINLWSARSVNTDFRNSIWIKKRLDVSDSVKVLADEKYNLAFFVELVLQIDGRKLHLCSPARVLLSRK